MEIKYWAGTDVGRKRSDNEDNFLIDKRLRLFVVADGMGGHASGEIASAMAVHGIREILHQERDILDVYDDEDPKSHVEVCTLLEYAVHHTCAQIFHKARREPEKRGMGTTLVVLLIIGARGFIAYVGDSRIYLLRGGVVYQLTEDHSLRNELIRMGKITADEFESSPYANLKNAMTRAVGVYESVEVDTLDFDIIPGDSFLLCSDGLYEYLTDDDIAHALVLPQIREVPGMLIDAANSRGGKDNITAVVVQVAGSADDNDRAAELNFTLDTLKTVPLFRELSYQQLVRVINLSRQSALEPGQVLCREGEPGSELMVVLRGRVELTHQGVRVAELGTGSHLGEMSLIDEGQRSVTATALEPGKLLAIGRDDFYEVLRREPALAVKLLWSFVRVLAGRLRTTTADLAVARTTAAQIVPDLTDLAEETTRAVPRPAGLAEPEVEAEPELDEEEDELERRPTMMSGMLGPRPAPGAPAPAPASSPPIEGVVTGDTVAAPHPRPSSNPAVTGETVVPPSAAPRPRPSSGPSVTGETVVPPSATPRPRASSGPSVTGETVVPPSAAPRPRASSGPVVAGETIAAPRPSGSSPITGETMAPPSANPRPRATASPAVTGDTAPPAAPPAADRGSSPVIAGELSSPLTSRPAAAGPAITGVTVVPPSGTPRPRRAPQVTQPNESAWSPGLRPGGGPPPIVPAPQAPTAPLDAPHLVPPAESDAPQTRRTSRRSTMPQPPGVPLAPAPPAAPSAVPTPVPIHAAPTAPLPAPMASQDVPARREEVVTAPGLPVVPPPSPARGGTMPPPGRGSTMPPPARTESDSDAPRVPAPRHAVATPQAGGTTPPPGADGAADPRRAPGPVPPVVPTPPSSSAASVPLVPPVVSAPAASSAASAPVVSAPSASSAASAPLVPPVVPGPSAPPLVPPIPPIIPPPPTTRPKGGTDPGDSEGS